MAWRVSIPLDNVTFIISLISLCGQQKSHLNQQTMFFKAKLLASVVELMAHRDGLPSWPVVFNCPRQRKNWLWTLGIDWRRLLSFPSDSESKTFGCWGAFHDLQRSWTKVLSVAFMGMGSGKMHCGIGKTRHCFNRNCIGVKDLFLCVSMTSRFNPNEHGLNDKSRHPQDLFIEGRTVEVVWWGHDMLRSHSDNTNKAGPTNLDHSRVIFSLPRYRTQKYRCEWCMTRRDQHNELEFDRLFLLTTWADKSVFVNFHCVAVWPDRSVCQKCSVERWMRMFRWHFCSEVCAHSSLKTNIQVIWRQVWYVTWDIFIFPRLKSWSVTEHGWEFLQIIPKDTALVPKTKTLVPKDKALVPKHKSLVPKDKLFFQNVTTGRLIGWVQN